MVACTDAGVEGSFCASVNQQTSVSEPVFAGVVDVERSTGLGYSEVVSEVRDRSGCLCLVLRLARPRFDALPDGGGVDQRPAMWEAALQVLVNDCLLIAKDDRVLLAELVAATLNMLPVYGTCTTPIVSFEDGVHEVFVAYVGFGDWGSGLEGSVTGQDIGAEPRLALL